MAAVRHRGHQDGERSARIHTGVGTGAAETGRGDAPGETLQARRGWRMPLSFVIARYFLYTLTALAGVWLASFTALSMALNAGIAYPANYGAVHADDVAASVQTAGTVREQDVPSAYRYAQVSSEGTVLATDLSDEALRRALDATAELRAATSCGSGDAAGSDPESPPESRIVIDTETASDPQTFGLDGTTYTVAQLSDGSFCILTSTYLPEYTSRELRDTLPNPQSIMIATGCAGSALAVALIARRAASVLTRKMAPLTDAAERIGREELDFTVGKSNVRQVDDVLAAMERMRGSLADSLEARWRAEQAQRDQVAALAHDLKTPLTVVRANAEYVADEARVLNSAGFAAGGAGALSDLAAAAQDAANGCMQVDRYVQLLIEASRGEGGFTAKQPLAVTDLLADVDRGAAPLARASGIAWRYTADGALHGRLIEADRTALERALANVVSNAFDHARGSVRLTASADAGAGALCITIEDDGPGFSPAALEHGCERFFRDDTSRTGAAGIAPGANGAHYGIGLFTAAGTARAHGGSLELSNRPGADGSPAGARVTLRLPLGAPQSPRAI